MRQATCAVVVFILFVAIGGSGAVYGRDLSGRVFLGKGLQLYLQEDESILTELLRSICLISSDVPILNINAMSVSRDMVFVGRDRKLYFHDVHGDGETYVIGTLADLSQARLRSGIRFYEQRQALDAFEGKKKGRLAVACSSRPNPEDEAPRSADLSFWLAELQREYDARFRDDRHRNNAILILNALPDALPVDGRGEAFIYENLKLFCAFVERGDFEYVDPVRAVLRTVMKRVKHGMVERGEGEGDGSAASRLLAMYEDLESKLDDLE